MPKRRLVDISNDYRPILDCYPAPCAGTSALSRLGPNIPVRSVMVSASGPRLGKDPAAGLPRASVTCA